jgi:hypothetical protein
MKIRAVKKFWVATHFIPVLVNDDYTGLTDTDIDQIEAFTDKFDWFNVTYQAECDTVDFRKCDICGLGADTVLLEVIVWQ